MTFQHSPQTVGSCDSVITCHLSGCQSSRPCSCGAKFRSSCPSSELVFTVLGVQPLDALSCCQGPQAWVWVTITSLSAQPSCVLPCPLMSESPCVWKPQKDQKGCFQLQGAGGSVGSVFFCSLHSGGVWAASPLNRAGAGHTALCPETIGFHQLPSLAAFY